MMKQTSRSGKNVKFEKFSLNNKFSSLKTKVRHLFLYFGVVAQKLLHKTCCSAKKNCCVMLDCNPMFEFCNK